MSTTVVIPQDMTSAWKTNYDSAQVIVVLLHKSMEFEEYVVSML
jgi:hypothetical protein